MGFQTEEETVPDELIDLASAIRQSWGRDTSADPEQWSELNPAWGQCAVTALLVQEWLGGSLLRSKVRGISHYWNRAPSGIEIDLTKEQFGDKFELGEVQSRDRSWVLSFPDTKERYATLKSRALLRLTSRRRNDRDGS